LRKTPCPQANFDGEAFLGKNKLVLEASREDSPEIPPETPSVPESASATEPGPEPVTFSFGPKMLRLLKLFEKLVHFVSGVAHR
jgi:hypothetical protein